MSTKKLVQVRARTPVRIDLAGGTLDIWPIYLLLKNPKTINLGIDLFAEADLELKPRPKRAKDGGKITLTAKDQAVTLTFPWADLKTVTLPSALALHGRLLKYFSERTKKDWTTHDVSLTTFAQSLSGAGLGGSSALAVAIMGVLACAFLRLSATRVQK